MDERDNLLPIANVGRIMKKILPPNAKISKEAKERIQECASEFISFVTGEASQRCNKENRKTMNGDDICWALNSLGFDNYSEAMMRYLNRLREFETLRAQQSCRGKNHEETSCSRNNNNIQQQQQQQERTISAYDFGVVERKNL